MAEHYIVALDDAAGIGYNDPIAKVLPIEVTP